MDTGSTMHITDPKIGKKKNKTINNLLLFTVESHSSSKEEENK